MKRRVYALTGSIGTGKSTVAEILASDGATIVDADEIAREVVQPGTQGLKEIAASFGADFLNKDGILNRTQLGNLIFRDETKRRELEAILHPKIRQQAEERLREAASDQTLQTPVLYSVPLYFESSHSYPTIEGVIVVYASEETALHRLMKRDGLSEEEAKGRIRTQIPIHEKVERADYVVNNDGSHEELISEVKRLKQEIY